MKTGRPPFEVTEEVISKAEKLAAQGLTLQQIAHVLGICYQTLNEKRKEFVDFSDAIKRGQAKGIAQVTNKLFSKAMEGDNTAMIFYLKNRDPENWQDIQKREHYGKDGGPVQHSVITGEMTQEQATRLYQELIKS